MLLPKHRDNGERGAALLLFTVLMALVVLPMIGFAIDVSILYLARARMVAAVDAAALAGGRALNVGLDFASQKQSAESTAVAYFNANYPANFLNSSNITVTPDAEQSDNVTRTVHVQASADVSLYFFRLLGYSTAPVAASAQTSRRDVNVMIVLDRSGSMVQVCQTMKNAAQSFADSFTNGRDLVGLITFMGSPGPVWGPNIDFESSSPNIDDEIQSIVCGGNTGSAEALSRAHQAIKAAAQPGRLNVIVFFTDGVPNGFTATYPIASNSSCNNGVPIAGYIADQGGIYQDDSPPNSSTTYSLDVAPNCAFTKGASKVGNDIAYIPDTDNYGNSVSGSGYRAISIYDNGQIGGNGNMWSQNIDAVSIDAADDAATQIRQDGILLYTIGLDGDGGLDNTLLARMANDPTSPYYNGSQPAGRYAYAANAGQLAAAFNSIRSEILRISQ